MATTRACGRCSAGVAFEFDALLEIHEVKLDLLRAARQREVGDDDVEQRGFAGPGLAGDKRVLARAFADGEVLQFGRAGAADGHAQFLVVSSVHNSASGGRDLGERHLDAVGIHAALARSCG